MSAPELRVWVEFSFDAAHYLPTVPATHKCHRMHGHTYRLRLSFAGPVDPTLGWVIDYAWIKANVESVVLGVLDHHTLNDVPGLEVPTCENLALWIHERLSVVNWAKARLVEIHIRETERAGVTLVCG